MGERLLILYVGGQLLHYKVFLIDAFDMDCLKDNM